MQTFYKICLILMIVGGINWGRPGAVPIRFCGLAAGRQRIHLVRASCFTLVGIAALCGIPGCFRMKRMNDPQSMPTACQLSPRSFIYVLQK